MGVADIAMVVIGAVHHVLPIVRYRRTRVHTLLVAVTISIKLMYLILVLLFFFASNSSWWIFFVILAAILLLEI